MILDALFQFTGVGTAANAPSNGDGLNDVITTAVSSQASSGTVDIGIGLQTTANPRGLAIPPTGTGPFSGGPRDLGVGDDPALKVLVELVTVPTGGTSLQVGLFGAPDTNGAPGTFTQIYLSQVFTAAFLETAGATGVRLMEIDLPRPPLGVLPRYLQLQYTSVGTFANLLLRGNVVLDRFDQIGSQTGILGGYVPGVVVAN